MHLRCNVYERTTREKVDEVVSARYFSENAGEAETLTATTNRLIWNLKNMYFTGLCPFFNLQV